MPRVIRMHLEYDGAAYRGFALQPGLLTIQQVLEQALANVLEHSVRVTAGGRTDAGVHAIGQVVSFETRARLPADAISRALNSRLPDDILAGPSQDTEPWFDARRCARRRHYRYSIWNADRPNLRWRRYSLHLPGRLDQAAMRQAAAILLGRHDFSSFIGHAAQESKPRSPLRTVERADCVRQGDLLHFDSTADAFARHMVRNLVGTLLLVGRGKLTVDQFQDVMAARDRRAAGPTAPPHGLTLTGIDYDSGEVETQNSKLATTNEDL
jgi:tRNA pseudouridine38-40 synthase